MGGGRRTADGGRWAVDSGRERRRAAGGGLQVIPSRARVVTPTVRTMLNCVGRPFRNTSVGNSGEERRGRGSRLDWQPRGEGSLQGQEQ